MILGAVLAGGRSSRFGSDKALALWKGRPLIEHAVERLRSICPAVIVCGRAYGDLPFVADRPARDRGPLGGLNAALHHAAEKGFDRVISVPCDAPELPDALLSALAEAPGGFVADMPVIGCWRAVDAPALDRFLAHGEDRSMRGWARAAGAAALALPAPPNVNRPADLAQLSR